MGRGNPGGRPRTPNYQGRLRAYEMFNAGCSNGEIARELGVTKPTIANWRRIDKWDERIHGVIVNAEKAVDLAGDEVNTVAGVLERLRIKMRNRLNELEALCASPSASVRLRAIQLWLKLAGVDRPIPDPITPSKDVASLKLIEDLLDKD